MGRHVRPPAPALPDRGTAHACPHRRSATGHRTRRRVRHRALQRIPGRAWSPGHRCRRIGRDAGPGAGEAPDGDVPAGRPRGPPRSRSLRRHGRLRTRARPRTRLGAGDARVRACAPARRPPDRQRRPRVPRPPRVAGAVPDRRRHTRFHAPARPSPVRVRGCGDRARDGAARSGRSRASPTNPSSRPRPTSCPTRIVPPTPDCPPSRSGTSSWVVDARRAAPTGQWSITRSARRRPRPCCMASTIQTWKSASTSDSRSAPR